MRLILASVMGAVLAAGGVARAAPLEAYGKLPQIDAAAAVSPDGSAVALIMTDGENRIIGVQSTADAKPLLLSKVGPAKVRDLQWAGNHHLIITVSTTRQPNLVTTRVRAEWYMAFDLDLDARRLRPLLEPRPDPDETMNTVSSLPEVRLVDGRPTVFAKGIRFDNGEGVPALFRIDLDGKSPTFADDGASRIEDWLIGPAGEILAVARYNRSTSKWSLQMHRNGGWRELANVDAPIEEPEILGLGPDGKSILVREIDKDGDYKWRELSREGQWSAPYDWGGGEEPILDPHDGRLIGHQALFGDEQRYVFLDARDQATWNAVVKAFGGDRVQLISWSDDRRKVLVRVDSAELGPAYSLVDLDKRDARWLGAEYTGLAKADISPVRTVSYHAADGLEISGYLTLPRGREAKGLPLVVLPHGGPAARDEPGFDWWSQALASRGYAVLQPNFRGSTGFGSAFLKAGYGQWGRKMQTDLSDGVRWLAAQGIVDPKRVCIVGASYGGYAALAGAAIDHGVYRCAASYGGVADLRALVDYGRDEGGPRAMRYWQRFMGAADRSDPVLTQYSPVARASEVDAPVLLIHGKDDTVVPLSQSRAMADALKRAGKSVDFVVLDGEDHWLSQGNTRLAMLKAMVEFLEKHNPPN